MLFLTLQHVVFRYVKVPSALCSAVIVSDLSLMCMSCCHRADPFDLACIAAAASTTLHIVGTLRWINMTCAATGACVLLTTFCKYPVSLL